MKRLELERGKEEPIGAANGPGRGKCQGTGRANAELSHVVEAEP